MLGNRFEGKVVLDLQEEEKKIQLGLFKEIGARIKAKKQMALIDQGFLKEKQNRINTYIK